MGGVSQKIGGTFKRGYKGYIRIFRVQGFPELGVPCFAGPHNMDPSFGGVCIGVLLTMETTISGLFI